MFDRKVLGGTLLIAGITIGAGMLALPLVTGACGFIGTVLVFTVCWAVMLWTAFLVLEINLAFPGELNLISMAKNTLGGWGSNITWLCYLLLLYALLSAYLAGGGSIIVASLQALGIALSLPCATLAFLLVFGLWGVAGIAWVDRVNAMLMLIMFASYIYLTTILFSKVEQANLINFSPNEILVSLSIVITAFGFHVIIPSISTYLQRDVRKIKICIVAGSTIPYLVYLIWEFLILGVVPALGEHGILAANSQGMTLSTLLGYHVESAGLKIAIELFSIGAIITSFLGISQSLFDFLRDGLGIQSRNLSARLAIFALAVLPPLVFALVATRGFILALEYAGVFVALLTGLLPIAMVYQARKKRLSSFYQAPFNGIVGAAGTIFFLLIIVVVFLRNFEVF